MARFSHITLILPCPDALCDIRSKVDMLLEQGFTDIILMTHDNCDFPNVTVLPYKADRGRGDALKEGLRYYLETRPDSLGFLTTEPENQPADIVKCAEALLSTGKTVLTMRDFSVLSPFSKLGNRISKLIFRIFGGISLEDTFSGLRGYPRDVAARLVTLPGKRFEWETNSLLFLQKENIPFTQIPITEVEPTLHFRLIADSWAVFFPIFSYLLRYVFSSVFSAVIDEGLYFVLTATLHSLLSGFLLTAIPSITARIVSSAVNFYMNKIMVFHSGTDTKKAFLRYYALAVPQMLAQMLLTYGLTWLLGLGESQALLRTGVHFLVMCVLFIFSFLVQKYWVFSDHSKKEKKNS